MNLDLKYEGFEENLYMRRPSIWGSREGVQYIFKFENGYGASVIKHEGSYGHAQDLWELAVIKFYVNDYCDRDWGLDYDTPITDDVIGGLTDEEICELLQRIKEL